MSIMCLLAVPRWVAGLERHVPSEYATIQAAIDAAGAGDEVIVAPGTHTGDGNRDLDYLGKAITVRSVAPNDPGIVAATVIDCQGSPAEFHRGFLFRSGEGAGSVLAGVTVTGGLAIGGVGIRCESSNPTITNCVITDNSIPEFWGSTAEGGGILCYASANPTLIKCTIRRNMACYGGGISCEYSSSPTITGCIISDNHARYTDVSGGGGGVSCGYGCSPVISECQIVRNTSTGPGGGVHCGGGTPIIVNCTIGGNTAFAEGGGLFFVNTGGGTIASCLITGNSATTDEPVFGTGGGVFADHSSLTVSNCSITHNSAPSYGGGVYCRSSNVTIANCILWYDTSSNGPEIALQYAFPSNVLSVRYSDVQGGPSAAYVGPGCVLDWGDGNIDVDPSFAHSDGLDDDAETWSDNDYHLLAGSPCVNAGSNLDVPGGVKTDIDGHARIISSNIGGIAVVDMGPDELAPGDIDRDRDADLADFALLAACFNGPNRPPLQAGCGGADLDGDADVDLTDFVEFQTCFNGPNRSPACP